jgi:D-aminoacyl-tRNA deacylase
MRALVQRVNQAEVTVEGKAISSIGTGLLILLGVKEGDSEAEAAYLADKVSGLRIFEDEAGKMNLSVEQVGGEILVVSQFTLYGDCRKGRRPSFTEAAAPEKAEALYLVFAQAMRDRGLKVATGVFGARMQLTLTNNGPVTLLLDTEPRSLPST